MKKCFVFFFVLNAISSVKAQVFQGDWSGELVLGEFKMPLIFHVKNENNNYSTTLDSPKQNAFGLEASQTRCFHDSIYIRFNTLGIVYKGVLKSDTIIGVFEQNGQRFNLSLSSSNEQSDKKEVNIRPQEPKKPYPYISEDITFKNKKDQIKLAGTFSYPNKNEVFPTVILISGSGPQDRNEELLGHRPFLIISDFLVRNGYAVLRFDDRGVANSEGDFESATTKDFSSDVLAAISYLKKSSRVDSKKIMLLGHSEGGLVAPMVAMDNDDVAGMVLLAAPAIGGDQILLIQNKLIGKAFGMSESELERAYELNQGAYQLVQKFTDVVILKDSLSHYFEKHLKETNDSFIQDGMSRSQYIKLLVDQLTSPWMIYFLNYDPKPALQKVNCPVLSLNGTLDMQVTHKENLEAIQSLVTSNGNQNVKTIAMEGMNHLFQECLSGSPAEYSELTQTFSPKALNEILIWLNAQKYK